MRPMIQTIPKWYKTLLDFAPIAINQATQLNFVGPGKKET